MMMKSGNRNRNKNIILMIISGLLVVVVVIILFQIKKNALMIGHCTARAVIATKSPRGQKQNGTKRDGIAY